VILMISGAVSAVRSMTSALDSGGIFNAAVLVFGFLVS
jgi:hypothetical protein